MKRPAAIAVALAFLFLLSWQARAQEDLPKLVKAIQYAVVTVFAYDSKGKLKGQGSGFFINQEGHFITNYHVLEGAFRAEVETSYGGSYLVKSVVAEDQASGLIIATTDLKRDGTVTSIGPPEPINEFQAKVPEPNVKKPEAPPRLTTHSLKISAVRPEVGERVVVIGSPMGLEQTLSEGVVSAIRHIPKFGEILQITAPISPGSSGSPVVNMKGEVVGIATFLLKKGQNLNFAIPGNRALALKPGVGKPLAQQESIKANWVPVDADFFFQQGLKLHKPGKLGKAIEAYKQAIQQDPDFIEAHINLGAAYYRLGRYQEAAGAFQTAVRLEPDNAESHCRLGSTYLALNRYKEAANAYKQAIQLDPNIARAHYFLGLTQLSLGNQGAAFEEYKILKTIDPKKANQLFNHIYK